MSNLRSAWITWVLLLSLWLAMAQGMRATQIKELRYFQIDVFPSLIFIYLFIIVIIIIIALAHCKSRIWSANVHVSFNLLGRRQSRCSIMASKII